MPSPRAHLHSCYGKTEAWYVIAVDGDDPSVWVGWRDDVDPTELAARIDAQDSAWLLDRLNKISVRPGDGILVPAGEPHATGAGVFVVEAQEPTDLSILLEWSVTSATRDESHLDLGFDVALGALSITARPPLTGWSPSDTGSIPTCAPPASCARFPRRPTSSSASTSRRPRVHRWRWMAASPSWSCVDGHGALHWSGSAGADQVLLERGQAWAVPAGIGDWTVSGELRAVVCRPSATWPDLG